jgi:hypothetical protein
VDLDGELERRAASAMTISSFYSSDVGIGLGVG